MTLEYELRRRIFIGILAGFWLIIFACAFPPLLLWFVPLSVIYIRQTIRLHRAVKLDRRRREYRAYVRLFKN